MLVGAAGTSPHAAWEPGHRGAAELMGTLVTVLVTHRSGQGSRGGGERHSAGEALPLQEHPVCPWSPPLAEVISSPRGQWLCPLPTRAQRFQSVRVCA